MPGKRCLSCNEDFPAKSKFCSQCGEALGTLLYLVFVFIFVKSHLIVAQFSKGQVV